eukprot:813191-Rhodomonas_salina.1
MLATFSVTANLTTADACMLAQQLQSSLRGTMDDYVLAAASSYHSVLVTSLSVALNGVSCDGLLSQFSGAVAVFDMMVVFSGGSASSFNIDVFRAYPVISAIQDVEVSPKIVLISDDTTDNGDGDETDNGDDEETERPPGCDQADEDGL